MKLSGEPLDFLAVTDHGEYLGVFSSFTDAQNPLAKMPFAQRVLAATEAAEIRATFQAMRELRISGQLGKELEGWQPLHKSAWQEVMAAADRHYEPGKFTTFIGYEYTSAPESQNLHRNVIFRGKGPDLPFTAQDSNNPEDLWAWLDARRAEGIEALAIPHNSNGSNGQMFRLETFDGEPLDAAYAELRMRNEPLVEVTQVKGTSETHPMLSPNDEWANFEIMTLRIATTIPSDLPGSYVREALGHGLELEEKSGFNPFKFGLIGSSDTHNAAGSFDESKLLLEGGKDRRRAGRARLRSSRCSRARAARRYTDQYYHLWGASGLAGVWAEENTRESIYDALRRKETFATSGPRLRVRFFAGYDFADGLASDPGAVAAAYQGGVPMGADLLARGDAAPRFLVMAMRDPRSAPLQRVQVVKGWVEDGKAREQVFDVACSDGRQARRREPSLPRQRRHRRSRDLRVHHGPRRRGAGRAVERPVVRSGQARLLLRARAGEPDLPVVDLGRHPGRRRAQSGAPGHDPGARLVVADLVSALVDRRSTFPFALATPLPTASAAPTPA